MPITKYITKKGPRYRASFKHRGARHTQAGFKLKQDARDWISDEKRKLKKAAVTSGAFSDLSSSYLDDVEGRMQPGTIAQKSRVYAKFIAHHGDIPLSGIFRDHVKSYLKAQFEDRGPKAANRDHRELHALFVWGRNEGKVQHNPASHIEKYPEEQHLKYVPPPQDVAKVLLAADREQRDLIEAYLNTACRMAEIFRLRKQDVDLKRSTLWVWTRKRKKGGKHWRSVAMNRTMREIVERRMKQSKSELVFENPRTGGEYQRNQHTVKFLLTRLCKKVEVKPFTIHAFRHFASVKAASAYEDGEISLRELQKLLGHQRLSTTEIYIENLKTDTARVVDILGREDGQSEKEEDGQSDNPTGG